MGRARPNDQQPQPQNAEIAAAVAALLLAGSPTVPALAPLLLPALPGWILALPELAADVAEEAARVTLTDPPAFDAGAGELERRASLENVLLRAFYGIAAARRLAEAVRGPSDTPIRERLTKALKAERSYLTAHMSARARNLEGARKTDRARELYGDVLSWNHGANGTPGEPRPNHVAADGKNFDLRKGVPVSTQGLPGTLPGCTCAWGPPRAGAKMLT